MTAGYKTGIKHLSTLTLIASVCLLAACENGGGQDDSDSSFVSAQTPAAEQGFGDLFWAEQAQNFEPFVPDPDALAANGPETFSQLGRWGDVMDWPLIATGAANMPDGRILAWAATDIDNFGGPEEFAHGTVYDPETNNFTPADNDMHNAFCAGCLLYTSPSPRDLSTSRMPSSA